MAKEQGYLGFLTPYVWMFIQSYEKLRQYLFTNATIQTLIQFEYSAFEEATVPICTFVFKNSYVDKKGCYLRLTDFRGGMEVQREKALEAIHNHQCGFFYEQNAKQYSKIQGNPVAYWITDPIVNAFETGEALGEIAVPKVGLQTGDVDLFVRKWYECEIDKFSVITLEYKRCKWFPYNNGGSYRKWYGNNDEVVNWFDNGRQVINHINKAGKHGARPQNREYYFKPGATWSAISSGAFSIRLFPRGYIFSNAGMAVFAEEDTLIYIAGFLNSKLAQIFLKVFNEGLNYNQGDIAKIPILRNSNKTIHIKELVENNYKIAKADWDSFETSWDFKYHPLVCKTDTIVEAFDQWQLECSNRFYQLKINEKELNRIFIDIYGLQNELMPEIEDKDITVRKADLNREIRSFISYALGCMFGRYSLNKEGLIYAGGNFDEFYKKIDEPLLDTADEIILDSNGEVIIVGEKYGKIKIDNEWKDISFGPNVDNCIPITDQEYFSKDEDIVARFEEFVKKVYGVDTLEENLDFIANALGNKGDTSREVIRNYFLKDFYADHLKVYQKRPIYWLFDSGKQNGFKALIYMHRYDADTVGRVRTDYLHRAQKYVETAMQSAQYTIENATSASEKSKATKAVTKYTKQLAEMKIYDEAIAHIANKRIEIDLDDGVKVNYAKFQGVEVAQEGKKALKVDLLAKLK